jgi:hypothetical protein
VPGRVEGLGQCQMLLRNDSARDALLWISDDACTACSKSYRSQHSSHELVRFLGLHETAHLEHANGQARYHSRVLGQGLLEYLAVVFVVFERADLGHTTKALKGSQVRLVHMCEVRICYYHVGQRLNVAETVRKSTGCSAKSSHATLPGLLCTWSGARVDNSWPSRSIATRSECAQRKSTGAG